MIYVIPNASKTTFDGTKTDEHGREWLKLRVNVPPENGKANQAVLKFLAKSWGIGVSSLELVSGHTSRYKVIKRIK